MTFERGRIVAAVVVTFLGWLSVESVSAADLESVSKPEDTESKSAGLDEIMVTAQRREENSQQVPIAISTVSEDALLSRGVATIQTLSSAVPNVNVTGRLVSYIFIRGVGSKPASLSNESSAALYVDGVYMPSNMSLWSLSFNNIERLEVLKGPQGTLFGRNSTAGVMQIITPNPTQAFSAKANVGMANYETYSADGYLSGGITENLAANVSALYENQNEGWGSNLATGRDIFRNKKAAVRSKWLYTPAESTVVTVGLDYSEASYDIGTQLAPGSIGRDGVTTYPGKFKVLQDQQGSDGYQQYGGSVRIDQDFGTLHGASITAYHNVKGHFRVDSDLTPQPLIVVDSINSADYLTQELQLSNRDPGRITWLVGGFFYGNEVRGADPQALSGTIPAGGYRGNYGVQYTRSSSGFAQATAETFADTKLTLGLRYTHESLKADGRVLDRAGQAVAGPFSDQITSNPLTWRVALDHQFTPKLLGYVSYNRGFKSGGFNLPSPGTAPVKPETLDAYEVGLKSQFLDNRVRLNLAAFYYKLRDLQVAIVLGGNQFFTNAAAARNYGLDANLDFAVTDHLTVSVGVGLLDAKYTDYPDAQGFTILRVPFVIPNAKGNDLSYAPPFTGFVNADYTLPTAIGAFKASANVAYSAKTYISPDNGFALPAYPLVSGSLEWWSPSERPFGVRLWGRNLTNEYYYDDRYESTSGWYQNPAEPRTYGLTLMKRF